MITKKALTPQCNQDTNLNYNIHTALYSTLMLNLLSQLVGRH